MLIYLQRNKAECFCGVLPTANWCSVPAVNSTTDLIKIKRQENERGKPSGENMIKIAPYDRYASHLQVGDCCIGNK